MTKPETPDARLRALAKSRTRRGEQRAEITRRLAGVGDRPVLKLRPLGPPTSPVETPTDDAPSEPNEWLRALKPKNKKALPPVAVNVTTPDEEQQQ